MKLFKKMGTILLIILSILGFALVGCKGKTGVKVAAVVPTGEAGEAMRNAINMAVEEVNAAGGIMNKKVSIVWVTEGADVSKLTNDLTQAIEREGAKYIIGGYSSGKVIPAMNVMKEKKVLWLGTGGASPQVVAAVKEDPAMKYYFRVGTLDSTYQGLSISQFAKAVLLPKKLTRVAYLRVNHAYALSIIKPAREAMEKMGFKTIIKDEAVKFMATDFTAFLDQCVSKKVNVIVCSFLLGETKNFIKQVAAKGLNKKIAIVGAMAPILKDEFAQEVGNDIAAYSTSLSPQSGPVDMTGTGYAVKFAKAYKAKYNKSCYWVGYMAYDAVKILKAAIDKAKSFESDALVNTMVADDFEFSGVSNYKWKKDNHDLWFGLIDGKRYADFPWFQFYPNGERYCVYPEEWKQKPFLAPGEAAE
jgi:branched-chain amino acid transport system substrate-binding protein